jgi:hypothetical protein
MLRGRGDESVMRDPDLQPCYLSMGKRCLILSIYVAGSGVVGGSARDLASPAEGASGAYVDIIGSRTSVWNGFIGTFERRRVEVEYALNHDK